MKSAIVKGLKKRVDRLDGPGEDCDKFTIQRVWMDANDLVKVERVVLSEDEYKDYKEKSKSVGNIWVNWGNILMPRKGKGEVKR